MGFAIYQCESAIGIHPELPSHIPPHSTPPGCHRALALGALLHTSNSHWLPVSPVIRYVFLFSQIIPPSPPPAESKILFFMSVSPLLPCT